MTFPNSKNFCGGNFQDWLEVNLLERCNARCAWCIERAGYHPNYHAPMQVIRAAAIQSGKTNIILLGGEPLLYPDLKDLVFGLSRLGRNVWITTNGFLLSKKFVEEKLAGVHGVNISIHHFDLKCNQEITGVLLQESRLTESIYALHALGASVRLNCNAIAGQIDNAEQINRYVQWARGLGANRARFAELKQDSTHFVDLAKEMNYAYGLNDDPFTLGCNSDGVIDGLPVNFRQMCGLQTNKRRPPDDPQQYHKQVLYYDGHIYDGWQTQEREETMFSKKDELNKITGGKLTPKELEDLKKFINKEKPQTTVSQPARNGPAIRRNIGGGCQY
jgi:pyruvate-formate lyase-activating enzyme